MGTLDDPGLTQTRSRSRSHPLQEQEREKEHTLQCKRWSYPSFYKIGHCRRWKSHHLVFVLVSRHLYSFNLIFSDGQWWKVAQSLYNCACSLDFSLKQDTTVNRSTVAWCLVHSSHGSWVASKKLIVFFIYENSLPAILPFAEKTKKNTLSYFSSNHKPTWTY